jgi:hypothetical protein
VEKRPSSVKAVEPLLISIQECDYSAASMTNMYLQNRKNIPNVMPVYVDTQRIKFILQFYVSLRKCIHHKTKKKIIKFYVTRGNNT